MLKEVLQAEGKMIPDGNLDLHKGMKNAGNGSNIGKYIRFLKLG